MALVNTLVLPALSGSTVFVVWSATVAEVTLLSFPVLSEKYICIYSPRVRALSPLPNKQTLEDLRGPATFVLSRKLVLVR